MAVTHPFPTSHPLWAGNLPTKASGIAEILGAYDAIFALGGKSLITILYSEGPAIPKDCRVHQLSADVRDLGRTYETPLSVVGEIKASLRTLQPLLDNATAPKREAYTALLHKAERDRASARQALSDAAETLMDAPTIPRSLPRELSAPSAPRSPLLTERQSPHPATYAGSSTPIRQISIRFCAADLAGECPQQSAAHWALDANRSSAWWAMARPSIRRKRSGRQRMKRCRSPSWS